MTMYSILGCYDFTNNREFWRVLADQKLVAEYPTVTEAAAAVTRFIREDGRPRFNPFGA